MFDVEDAKKAVEAALVAGDPERVDEARRAYLEVDGKGAVAADMRYRLGLSRLFRHRDADGAIEVLTAYTDFESVKNTLESAGFVAEVAEVTMRPENSVTLSGEDAAKMQKLLDVLEDLDDVQNVFHNAEIED
jgi:transcriptional/translational regulatory protein YebC/TACO1